MAMPQRDNNIEQIHRLEGLIAYAEKQKDEWVGKSEPLNSR